MERFNEYVLIAKDEKEYDEYNNQNMKNLFDVTFYLNILKTKSSKMLFDLINFNIDFFDSKNICVDFQAIKNTLKLNEHFVEIIDKDKPLDVENIKIDINSLSLTKSEASELCLEIHNRIFDSILRIKGVKFQV